MAGGTGQAGLVPLDYQINVFAVGRPDAERRRRCAGERAKSRCPSTHAVANEGAIVRQVECESSPGDCSAHIRAHTAPCQSPELATARPRRLCSTAEMMRHAWP